MRHAIIILCLSLSLGSIKPLYAQSGLLIRLDNYKAFNKAYYAYQAKKRKKLKLREYNPKVTKFLQNDQVKKVKGFSYNKKSQTLTLKKVNQPATTLRIYNAEDFFSIRFIGKVRLRAIEVTGKRGVLTLKGQKGHLILSDKQQVFTDPHEALMTISNFNQITIKNSLKVSLKRKTSQPLLSYSYIGHKSDQILYASQMTKTKKSFVNEAPMMRMTYKGKILTING